MNFERIDMNKYRKRLKEQRRQDHTAEKPRAASLITFHGYFVYQCDDCHKEFKMWLQQGVEGPGKKQPAPFFIRCPYCGGSSRHFDWTKAKFYQPFQVPLLPGTNYFALDEKLGHARAVFVPQSKESEENQ